MVRLEAPGVIGPAELRQILYEGRVDARLRPVANPAAPQAVLYLALPCLRAVDDRELEAGRYRTTAARSGLLGLIDRLLLLRCAEMLRAGRAEGREMLVLCGIAAASLTDPAFLGEVEQQLSDDPKLADALVLALDHAVRDSASASALARLRRRGMRFCLRRVGPPPGDAVELRRSGFEFVLLEAARFALDGLSASGGPALLELQRVVRGAGPTLLVGRSGAVELPGAQGYAGGRTAPSSSPGRAPPEEQDAGPRTPASQAHRRSWQKAARAADPADSPGCTGARLDHATAGDTADPRPARDRARLRRADRRPLGRDPRRHRALSGRGRRAGSAPGARPAGGAALQRAAPRRDRDPAADRDRRAAVRLRLPDHLRRGDLRRPRGARRERAAPRSARPTSTSARPGTPTWWPGSTTTRRARSSRPTSCSRSACSTRPTRSSSYDPLFGRARARGLPMVCVNPDLVVHRQSGVTSPCAGLLASATRRRAAAWSTTASLIPRSSAAPPARSAKPRTAASWWSATASRPTSRAPPRPATTACS